MSERAIQTEQDGNMRCAHYHNFVNLQESPAGFGPTDEEAVAALLKEAPPRCRKAMWFGTGAPAGTCDEPAYGPDTAIKDPGWLLMEPEVFRCPLHGGPTLEQRASVSNVARQE